VSERPWEFECRLSHIWDQRKCDPLRVDHQVIRRSCSRIAHASKAPNIECGLAPPSPTAANLESAASNAEPTRSAACRTRWSSQLGSRKHARSRGSSTRAVRSCPVHHERCGLGRIPVVPVVAVSDREDPCGSAVTSNGTNENEPVCVNVARDLSLTAYGRDLTRPPLTSGIQPVYVCGEGRRLCPSTGFISVGRSVRPFVRLRSVRARRREPTAS